MTLQLEFHSFTPKNWGICMKQIDEQRGKGFR